MPFDAGGVPGERRVCPWINSAWVPEPWKLLEIDDDGCGRLEFELPLDATDEDVTYIESLVPRIESGLLELRDLSTDEVVLSCRPSLTGESLLKTATRIAVKLRH